MSELIDASARLLLQEDQEDLDKLPAKDVKRILEKLESLRANPSGLESKELTGLAVYRARVGVYRIIYEILDDKLIVQVIKVAHRSDAYR